MPVGTRRSDVDIIRDILDAGMGTTGELRLAVNLSHTQMQKYLAFLEGAGLVTWDRSDGLGASFSVTGKGEQVLQLLQRLSVALTPVAP